MTIEKFPEPFQHDIETAVSVLCSLGAQHVYIFGSLVEGSQDKPARDIDIAVDGLPQTSFFKAYGELLMKLDHEFDLVDLSNEAAFSRRLKESGRLERVA